MNIIGVILICILLIGCRSVDPVVGSWKTFDDTVIVLAADGKGMQTFAKEGYFELNGSYEGLETELTWEKKEENIYTIYYHFEEFISPDEAELKEGKLIFDQGDYLTILTKVEPVDGGQ